MTHEDNLKEFIRVGKCLDSGDIDKCIRCKERTELVKEDYRVKYRSGEGSATGRLTVLELVRHYYCGNCKLHIWAAPKVEA